MNARDEQAPRLTPTQRYHELALAIALRQPREADWSVELTRNAKGDVQISVGVKGGAGPEVGAEAEAEFDRLCEKYPRAEHELEAELAAAKRVGAIQGAAARKARAAAAPAEAGS